MRIGLVCLTAVALLSCREAPTPPVKEQAVQETKQQKKRRHRSNRGQKAAKSGTPGEFDFYVLSLSWSPGFCASPAGKNDVLQCGGGRRFSFILHGLWPQYEQRGWPQNCSTERVDEATADAMINIMPSPKLILHEWQKHGTCSGLSAKDYFEEASEAYHKIRIPQQYQAPTQRVTFDPAVMRRDFGAANPELGEQGFAVVCSGNGRFLQEVRACLTKDLAGRACNREVEAGGCKSREVIMQPVR